jgi:hypothetical protein
MLCSKYSSNNKEMLQQFRELKFKHAEGVMGKYGQIDEYHSIANQKDLGNGAGEYQ